MVSPIQIISNSRPINYMTCNLIIIIIIFLQYFDVVDSLRFAFVFHLLFLVDHVHTRENYAFMIIFRIIWKKKLLQAMLMVEIVLVYVITWNGSLNSSSKNHFQSLERAEICICINGSDDNVYSVVIIWWCLKHCHTLITLFAVVNMEIMSSDTHSSSNRMQTIKSHNHNNVLPILNVHTAHNMHNSSRNRLWFDKINWFDYKIPERKKLNAFEQCKHFAASLCQLNEVN